MKRILIASVMCVVAAAGAFAGPMNVQPWVLDLSARLTTLSEQVEPGVKVEGQKGRYRSPITTTSVTGYLCVDDFSSNSFYEGVSTFVMTSGCGSNKVAFFATDIPTIVWNDGQTVVVFVDYEGVVESVIFGTVCMASPQLRSLSASGNLVTITMIDAYGDNTGAPAGGSVSLRNDRALTTNELAGGSGPDAVAAYLLAHGYSLYGYSI